MGDAEEEKMYTQASFETDLTMPNNIPQTAQKNDLSSWEKAFIYN